MAAPILNIDDLEYEPWGKGVAVPGTGEAPDRFEARLGAISRRVGGVKLGYNVTIVPPGKRAFPLHNHIVNEEMFMILEGSGEIRIGSQRHPVRAGDFIACPPGGQDVAHQIINTSDSDLKYLAVSTQQMPEVVEYPDSGTFGTRAIIPPGADGEPRSLRFKNRPETSLPYWDGE